MLRRNIFLVLFALCVTGPGLFAAHTIGGEMTYKCLGNNDYEVTLVLYRDCNHSTGFDFSATITAFDNAGNQVSSIFPTVQNTKSIVSNFSTGCFSFSNTLCVEKGIYTGTINLPASTGGYTLAYQRCCTNASVVNVTNPLNAGLTVVATIPGSATACNNTPQFKNFPKTNLCAGFPINIDCSATDADGDSLAYELCDSYTGGSLNNPLPSVAAPPYATITYGPGYSGSSPLNASSGLSIDPKTGALTGSPNMIGKWMVKICVKEYRNGVLIGSTGRDFQFNINSCLNAVASVVAPQPPSASGNQCNGLSVSFQNNSVNATAFHWDFGDPVVTNDTSNIRNPSWTYTSAGTYTIVLIASPGSMCADTSYTMFTVYPLLQPSFIPPASQCIESNSFSFTAGGSFIGTPTSTFSWNFGAAATPTLSTDKDPSGISYNTAGTYPVSLAISENGCTETYTGNITVNPMATADYGFSSIKLCVPHGVQFDGSTIAGAGCTIKNYNWTFGDGNASALMSPSNTYTLSGTYDVMLTVMATNAFGCDKEYSFEFSSAVIIEDSPNSQFTATPLEAILNDPEITFTDMSSAGATMIHYYFDDGGSYSGPNGVDAKHKFLRYGNHTIMQVAESDIGCTDTSYVSINILRGSDFIPNAFTINGDGINENFTPIIINTSEYLFQVYNRWGESFFETNDPNQGWDGTHKGVMCEQGVYVYNIIYTDAQDGSEHSFVGRLTLLR